MSDTLADLKAAVKAADLGKVKELIETEGNGVDVNTRMGLECTPIVQASVQICHDASNADIYYDMIVYLIEMKADLELDDYQNETALTYLSRESDYEKAPDLVRKLIAAGANINHVPIHKQTPLLGSVQNGCPEIAEILLDNGAEVKDKETLPWLLIASLYDLSSIVKRLIEAGCDPTMEQSGMDALGAACWFGAFENAQYFVNNNHCKPDAKAVACANKPLPHYNDILGDVKTVKGQAWEKKASAGKEKIVEWLKQFTPEEEAKTAAAE